MRSWLNVLNVRRIFYDERVEKVHRKMCNGFEDVLITEFFKKNILQKQKAIKIRYHNLDLIYAV